MTPARADDESDGEQEDDGLNPWLDRVVDVLSTLLPQAGKQNGQSSALVWSCSAGAETSRSVASPSTS